MQKKHLFQKKYKKHKGFTLIEMMIVIAMISILAMIALPQYTRHVIRSHRAIGLNVLQANILSIEQFRTQTGAYPTAAQINAGNVIGYLNQSETGSARFYTYGYRLNNNDLATVTMTSNNINNSPSDADCATLTLNTNGVQTAANSNGQSNANIIATCWQNR